MQLAHGASVLVTDGRKAIYLRNEGDGEFANLRLVRKWESPVPADRELRSDAPGRVFASRGGSSRRSSYDEGNFHDQQEAEFAEHIAEFVNSEEADDALQLVLVAPPRTLGVLRKHLRRDVADRLVAEIPKDLVKHPIPEIERLLTAHRERA
jgi:protein required for attachment to host cells